MAVCTFSGRLAGSLSFFHLDTGLRIAGEVRGLVDGAGQLSSGRHGFHIHQEGALGNGCKDAGGHFNPGSNNHGDPSDTVRHVGDLGNIEAVEGVARVEVLDGLAQLGGPDSVLGRAIVIHAGEDDLGLGGDQGSLRTGNAGPRIGCCVIT